jgi:CubicO group peptidase (beta-lactamase class C family)
MEAVSREELAGWAQDARSRWNVPGLAVGVMREGAVVAAADGIRQLGRDEPASRGTLFRIASITKPFVATLAMTLVQEGSLSLDEPPPQTRADATLRQLLSHQGGLACEWPEPLDAGADGDDALLRLAEGEPERLPVGPGELFSYSNVGFWLVGAVVARACGTTFEEALRARVLAPLGLASTSFDPRDAARGHDQVEPGAAEHRPVDDKYPRVRRPSGGLWSSVDDLLCFASHHLGGPGPLTRESIAEMQRPHVATGSESYGLGWSLHKSGGRRVVEHLGSAAGFQSLLRLVPEDGVAFAGLANSSRGAAALREVLEPLGLAREEASERPLAAEHLAAFAGRYVGQGIELELIPADGRLCVELTEVDPFSGEQRVYPSVRARPIGEREFEIVDGEWQGERFDFPRDGVVSMGTLAVRLE